MPDETELRAAATKARQAQELIDHPLLTEAFEKLERAYLDAMLATSISDGEQREKLYLAMKTLPAIKRNLEVMLMDGSIAQKQLANLAEDQARAKRGK